MGMLTIPGDISLFFPGSTEDVSNGYHSFAEINTHRCLLFTALMLTNPSLSWKTSTEENNNISWFTGGMTLPSGTITMHLPKSLAPLLDTSNITTQDMNTSLEYLSPQEMAKHLHQWLKTLNSSKEHEENDTKSS